MYIRGVDFSRGNIIVGTDAEASVPTPGGTAQLQGRNVVEARVITAAGGEATLDIEGARVVVETHVSLNAGDKLFVRVQEAAGNAIRLSVLASEPATGQSPLLGEAALDDLLRELGLPADERTRLAARALIARDGTLDRPALQRMLADLKPFAHVTPREAGAAALLQKAGVPVTPATVEVVAARHRPDAPPSVGERLAALRPGLEQLARQGGRLAGPARELLEVLKGLPLDARADAARVASALRGWIDRLTPSAAKAENRSPSKPAKQDLARLEGVHTSPRNAERMGINNVARSALAAPDLASQLERMAKALGGGHPELKQQIGEAVAEVRYLQLSNGPPPPAAGPQQALEYLVPLLTPQLAPGTPESQVQIRQKPGKPGEPVDPNNTELQLLVETEHLATVQADVTIKDGVVSLALGVSDPEDRALLAEHVEELREAIAALGFETGRFGARQARGLPPRVRQAEGLGEVVRFDRRV